MKKVVPIVLVLLILAGVLGGGWYYLGTLKSSLKPEVNKQTASFRNLNERMDQTITLFQESSDAEQNTKVNVLGAQTSTNPKENAVSQVEQVLGVEDSEDMKRARDIVELLTQSNEELKKITDTNNRIKSMPGLPLLQSMFKVTVPVDKTEAFVTTVSPIIDTLKKEEDLTIRAYSIGYDLGATFQLAVLQADEVSIKKLEEKINNLDALAAEEKALLSANIPKELKQILEKSVAQSTTMLEQFKDIPDIIRKKDGVALQKKLSNLVVDAAGESVKIKVELVSFLKNNETLRSINSLREEWDDSSKTL